MKQVEMSIVSYKLTIYLFIIFLPTFFYKDYSTYVSLKTFFVVFVTLVLCVAWQKHVVRLRNNEGGILFAVKGKKNSLASFILFMLCIQVITLKVIVNICLFINMFILNNLMVIDFNIHVLICLLYFIIIMIGTFVFAYGRRNVSRLKAIATLVTTLFLGVVLLTGLSSAHITSLHEQQTNVAAAQLIERAAPFWALFSTWLLLTTIINHDLKHKKLDVLYNIVNFLLILFFLTFFFNKLIGHVEYGINTFISQFFLLAQTIFYIILLKLYFESANNLGIISKLKEESSKFLVTTILTITFFVGVLSQITIEQALELCVTLMFLIVAFFLLFSTKNIEKNSHKIINIIFVLFYVSLLVSSISVYILLVIAICIISIKILYRNSVETLHKIENEFFIKDQNGNKLRFRYQDYNLVTYMNNLKTTKKIENIHDFLYELGIEDFKCINEEKYEIKRDDYIIIDKRDYYIDVYSIKPDIKLKSIKNKTINIIMSHFWEHRNIGDFEV